MSLTEKCVFKDTFFCLYEKDSLHNHLQITYPFPTPNIKGVPYLGDYACRKTLHCRVYLYKNQSAKGTEMTDSMKT